MEEDEYCIPLLMVNERVISGILLTSQEIPFVMEKIFKDVASLTKNSKGESIVRNGNRYNK